jgi:serine/threonine protein kinase
MGAVTSAPADPLIGTLIDGRYRVERAIASGGFGTVYAALQVSLGSLVALKVLKLPPRLRPDQLATLCGGFFEEARTLKRLRHPNIVAALDVGLLPAGDDGVQLPYLVMEWCGGPTLEQHLGARGGRPLPLDEAWRLFEPLLDAMAHAHAHDVAHRDLKPANVLLDLGGEGGAIVPRVVDFGIAKIVAPGEVAGTGATNTVSGPSAFTPRYAAPEQLAGARTGPWTDVHALALLFVELVSGRPAFGKDEAAMFAIFDPARPTPGARGVEVGGLEPVLRRALALRPMDRYPDAAALALAMRAVTAPGPGAAPDAAIVAGHADLTPWDRGPASHASPQAGESPTVDSTAAPPSHTLRTGGAELPAGSTRSRALTAGLAIAVAAGALLLGVAAGVSRHRGAAPVHPRLREVPIAELDRRAGALGLGQCAPQESGDYHVISCERGLVSLMHVGLAGSAAAALAVQVNAVSLAYAKVYGAAEFAIDGNVALILAAPVETAGRSFDALLDGALVDLRRHAESFSAAPARSAAAGEALVAWTGTDLWASVAATGEQITYAEPSGSAAQVTVAEGQKMVIIGLHTEHATTVLEVFKRSKGVSPFAYARDGDKLLVVYGAPDHATVAFMRRVLGGARAAEVGVYPPP